MTDVELRKAIKGTLKENVPDIELKEMRYKLYEAMKQQMLENKSLKLVEWFPFTIEEINGMLVLGHTYRRQLGNNPIVHCEVYTFQNYDRTHMLTMSYRESEKEIWAGVEVIRARALAKFKEDQNCTYYQWITYR